MATLERFEDIDAWKKARELIKAVYQLTSAGEFARDFGLRDQIRRASVSIMSTAQPFIFNSDRGSHFTSPQYTGLVLAAGSKVSMDGKGRALDNIFTERLWRTVKWENVYLADYATTEESRTGLANYFDFYNCKRGHQSLSYQTPAQLYFDQARATPKN